MKLVAHMICLLLSSPTTKSMALTAKMKMRPIISVHQLQMRHTHHHQRLVQHFSTLSSSETDATVSDADTQASDNNSTKAKSISSSRSNRRRFTYPPPPDTSSFPSWSYEPRDFFRFEILYESTKSLARVGRIHTPHGIIDTPSFVAVGTNAALKAVDFRDADECGQQLIFANTYHLLLQPGTEVVEEAGGLHKFINRRNRPLITDSG